LIERDPANGHTSVRLPLPDPDTLRRLAELLQVMASPPPNGRD